MSTATIPAWRLKAPPGVSLAAAMASAPAPVQAAPSPTGRLDPGLQSILRPDVSVRWRSARVSTYTPQYVEYVLANGLAGDLTAQWELFDLMEETWPRLSKNLNEIKRAVSCQKWTVTAWAEDDSSPSAEAEARAKLVSHIIWKMRPDSAREEQGFNGIVYDLLDGWGKGLSLVELLWEQRSTKVHGDIVAVRCGQWVHPQNYGLAQDGSIGLRRQAGSVVMATSAVDPLPEFKFLVAIAKAKSSHFAGAALLRPLAWWWAASNFSAQWLLNYAQIFGLPIRWANYAEGATTETVAKICEALADMGSAAWSAFPEGTTLNLLEGTKTSGNSPQESVIDRADKQCDLLVLGQTLTTDAGGRGTQALGTVHERVRADVIQSAADWVAGVLSHQLVNWILELNYGDTEMAPELRCEPVREKDETANAQRMAVILGAGIRVPTSYLYEYLDIPEPAPGEETIGGPAPAAIDPGNQPPSQNAPGRAGNPDGVNTAAASGSPQLMAFNGLAGDFTAARSPDLGRAVMDEAFIQAAKADLAASLASDLAPVRRRLEAIAAIEDLDVRRHRIESLLGQYRSLAVDILRDPEAVQSLARIQGTAMADGLLRGGTGRGSAGA